MIRIAIHHAKSGQGLLEYSLILSLVALVVAGTLALIGVEVVEFLETVPAAFDPGSG